MVITMNYNPSFIITLHDHTNAQQSIKKVSTGNTINFKINNNRIEAYYNKLYIGYILKKDTTEFKYILDNPNAFEGIIKQKQKATSTTLKLIIEVRINEQYSYKLFKENKNLLNTLISLKTIFKEKEEIYCNYGPAIITTINDKNNTIEVDISGLGKKKIYDIYGIEKK
jgi:hypothetical protein